MVVPLGPGKFYGSSLPRPRIYTDTKFNPERIDPPISVLDPLLSWADEAHWSMGGLSFKRLRLQGRIEGNVKRLRAQREKLLNDTPKRSPKTTRNAGADAVSPPPAPMAVKRRFLDLNDVESENEGEESLVKTEKKRVLLKGAVRKLGDDFGLAAENDGLVSQRKRKMIEEDNVGSETSEDKKRMKGKPELQSGVRTSPRFAKHGHGY